MSHSPTTTFDKKLVELKSAIYNSLLHSFQPLYGRSYKHMNLDLNHVPKNLVERINANIAIEADLNQEELSDKRSHFKYYSVHDDWRENVYLIEKWIKQNQESQLKQFIQNPIDQSWLYKVSQLKEYKQQLPKFTDRVEFKLEPDEFNIFEKSIFWNNYLYYNQIESQNKEISNLTQLGKRYQSLSSLEAMDRLKNLHDWYTYEMYPNPRRVTRIAEMIAFYELEQEYINLYKKYFYSINNSLSLFNDNFFSFPKINHDESSEDCILINIQKFIGYNLGIFIFTGIPEPSILLKLASPPIFDDNLYRSEMSKQMVALIGMKLEIVEDTHFEYILSKEMKVLNQSESNIDIKATTLSYLKEYYTKIQESNDLKLNILDGIQFSNETNQLFCEYMITLISKRIAINDQSILEHTILPSEFEDILSKTLDKKKTLESHNSKLKQILKDESVKSPLPFFYLNKIKWRKDDKYIRLLDEILRPLYTQKNKYGEFFMNKDDVMEMKKRNFSCYPDTPFQPKHFEFNGNGITLHFYFYQVYKFMKKKINNSKKRWAQFQLQNFSVFKSNLISAIETKSYESFTKELKDYETLEQEEIFLNIDELNKILK